MSKFLLDTKTGVYFSSDIVTAWRWEGEHYVIMDTPEGRRHALASETDWLGSTIIPANPGFFVLEFAFSLPGPTEDIPDKVTETWQYRYPVTGWEISGDIQRPLTPWTEFPTRASNVIQAIQPPEGHILQIDYAGDGQWRFEDLKAWREHGNTVATEALEEMRQRRLAKDKTA